MTAAKQAFLNGYESHHNGGDAGVLVNMLSRACAALEQELAMQTQRQRQI